jgi:hypothetical protein
MILLNWFVLSYLKQANQSYMVRVAFLLAFAGLAARGTANAVAHPLQAGVLLGHMCTKTHH